MNKAQELAVITAAAAKLGEDSYLGPWLVGIADELERDLRSDIVPNISLRDAARQAESIVAAAVEKAAQITLDAAKAAEAQFGRINQARAEAAAALYRVSRDAERLANSVSIATR
jgi:hypothetical protein